MRWGEGKDLLKGGGMALSPEICQECQKSISRKAVANVWNGERIVCTACYRKLDRERHQCEALEAARSAPATERQKAYASDLGIHFPANIRSQEISDLIEQKVNPPAGPELIASARAWGLSPRAAQRAAPF
jgi:hypothetical protein